MFPGFHFRRKATSTPVVFVRVWALLRFSVLSHCGSSRRTKCSVHTSTLTFPFQLRLTAKQTVYAFKYHPAGSAAINLSPLFAIHCLNKPRSILGLVTSNFTTRRGSELYICAFKSFIYFDKNSDSQLAFGTQISSRRIN